MVRAWLSVVSIYRLAGLASEMGGWDRDESLHQNKAHLSPLIGLPMAWTVDFVARLAGTRVFAAYGMQTAPDNLPEAALHRIV